MLSLSPLQIVVFQPMFHCLSQLIFGETMWYEYVATRVLGEAAGLSTLYLKGPPAVTCSQKHMHREPGTKCN